MLKLIVYVRPAARYLMIIWMLVILTLSSIPYVQTFKIHTAHKEIRLDYLMHFTQYGILAFFTLLTFAGSEFGIQFRKVILIMMSLIIIAIADEFHQKLIPGRSFSVYDIMSNVSGIVVMISLTVGVFVYIRKKEIH